MNLVKSLALAGALALAGCGSLVSSGKAPDELAVISGPRLTVPPSFELRPPTDKPHSAADALRQQNSAAEAQAILLGQEAAPTEAAPTDAQWLLEKAGAHTADPMIRDVLKAPIEETK